MVWRPNARANDGFNMKYTLRHKYLSHCLYSLLWMSFMYTHISNTICLYVCVNWTFLNELSRSRSLHHPHIEYSEFLNTKPSLSYHFFTARYPIPSKLFIRIWLKIHKLFLIEIPGIEQKVHVFIVHSSGISAILVRKYDGE